MTVQPADDLSPTDGSKARGAQDNVPLVDLRAQHEQVADEVRKGWESVVNDCEFILGNRVTSFERDFAAFCGVSHCVGVANGTDALEFALRAVGVGPGDEVLLPANTFVATAFAVMRLGATPVPVDVSPVDLLMDPHEVASRIGPLTKAVVPVHLYGQFAAMEALRAVTVPLGIPLVEDAAQAHGASRHGAGVGSLASAASFSFYPAKNLGAYGDAGAVVTDSPDIARQVRSLGNYGSTKKYHHPETGFNSRLDPIQAVVLASKLKHLTEWNRERRVAASRYDELLAGLDEVRLPVVTEGNDHVWHLYVVRVPRRDHVLSSLNAAGIGASVHYPVPVHLHGAFSSLGYGNGDFPVAEVAATEILSLPIFPGISADQQVRVAGELRKAL